MVMMSIKVQRILNIAMVLIALSTLPLMGLYNIKRFLPVSILIGGIEGINALIGKKRRWWVFYNKPNSYLFNEFPFNIGVFLVTSLWIMKWSYGKFLKFTLLNAMGNALFAYPFAKFARKIKYFTLVRLNHLQFFFYFFSKVFLFYGLQYLFEKYKKPD
ncbi:hypothetical protein [Neobacillus citreus]|uniref:Uncharacterized protein n=2 Tax=Neobacillus citreus TaxID=2833578 RepID=A0A9J6MZ57_9BACI|nr:hypothetical protein [Neobacillus citreus]MCH6268828.1 hypothetical protein [Neobacillus citreus]